MKQYNCKNCGAPVEHTYNHRCKYCNSILDFNEPKEDAIEVKAEDLVNIELRDIEIIPYNNTFRFTFSGFKCPMPKIYEYDGEGTCVSKSEVYINPPKCGFLIEISIESLEKYGMGYLEYSIRNSGLRYNEVNKVIGQIVAKSNNYLMRYLC